MITHVKLGGLAVPNRPEALELANQLIALSLRTVDRPVTAIVAHGEGRLTGHEVPTDGARLQDVMAAAQVRAASAPPAKKRRPLRKAPK